MILPNSITERINELYKNLGSGNLKKVREDLTDRYKNNSGQSKNLVLNNNDSILYAVSRMPATYSVIYSLLKDLFEQNILCDINSAIDAGSGTGAGYFALKEFFTDVEIELYEKNENMINVFDFLAEGEKKVNNFDLIKDNFENKTADLVISSYVLSEMTNLDRLKVFDKLLNISNKYTLILDTGTPETYKNMMELKDYALRNGYKILAPCMLEKCPLSNDYCQFYSRVERSSLLRQSKSGNLPYEDEKYFYLLISKNENICNFSRVIRRPKIKTNEIELVLCSKDGVSINKITKKDKEKFKKAKKVKINGEF